MGRSVLARGDRIPDFVLPNPAGTPTRFYGQAGGAPSVLLWTEGAVAARLAAECGVPVHAVLRVQAPAGSATVFLDGEGAFPEKVLRLTREDPPTAFVLDSNLHVVAAIPCDGQEAPAIQAALAALAALASPAALEIGIQAPVLLIPDVLEPEACQLLVGLLEANGGTPSGVEETYAGQRQDVVRGDAKKRLDHVVEDPELMHLLTSTLGRRILPEVQRAFAYRATRFEGFKLARYEAGGFFRPHRDNLSPATAHRRFSVTLNLDRGYQGGHLRFPEYGPHLYRPGPGEALLFSASLLHEVTPVTEGSRHVLITFIFGEEVKRVRE